MRYTPETVTKLKPNQVIVVGTNPQGRHGKGAALQARLYFGAEYGNPMGRQGQSYAIVTKELRGEKPPITLGIIIIQIKQLLLYASYYPENEFLVVKIGCSLAGFTTHEMRHAFQLAISEFGYLPSNMVLPKEFYK